MKTLLQLLVVVVLGYAFWIYGLPWVQRTVGQARAPVSSPAPGAGGVCVQSAARASESLHDDMMEKGRTLYEADEWNRIAGAVESALFEAQGACKCDLESCELARQALGDLSAVFELARSDLRTSQSIPLDQSRRAEQANQALWEAYELARDGK